MFMIMRVDLAESLVDELEKHRAIISPDRNIFLDVLVATNVPESSRFHEELPETRQLLTEDANCRYHYLSLRRILRNRNVRMSSISGIKAAVCDALSSAFGMYSSDVLSRKLRTDPELVGLMARCEAPFSLLGKFQTYDYNNPDETLFVATRPVLIIPGASDSANVLNWEQANTIYESEQGIPPFTWMKRVAPEEYLVRT